jgi:glycosyltransferase involved in cell wall biosynthesis
MRILFLNPFHGGSHAAVAEGYARHSQHEIELLTLPIDGGWRWRMRGAAVTFARMLRESVVRGSWSAAAGDGQRTTDHSPTYDLILATDMLDLATFLALTRTLTAGTPAAIYFHENQLTYPLPHGRARDLAFPWLNYTSALAADALFFNSGFHRSAFLDALPSLPGRYHDYRELDLIDMIAAKAHILPPGIDLARLDQPSQLPATLDDGAPPVILWNSRWEYDKQPAAFFDALIALEQQGLDFRLIVVGEHIDPRNPDFVAARARLASRVLAWGYVPDATTYRELLWCADIVVSTAIQEFFGIGVIEAMYCGCVPILPRRLSYPEILPPEHHAACLYGDQSELVAKLGAAIRDLPALKARDFRSVAARYAWPQRAMQFDTALEQVKSSNFSGS